MARNARRTHRPSTPRVTIRMYRLSVGDSFLMTFATDGDKPFRILIDCGIHQSQKGGSDMIRNVVNNLHQDTNGEIDILVITHEHADHISGFRLAHEMFESFTFGATWFAWTEDNDDDLAKEVAGARYRAIDTLVKALGRKRLDAREDADGALLESLLGFWEPDQLTSPLGFFGGGAGSHAQKSLRTLLGATAKFEYKRPGMEPFEIPGAEARIFVLGPPRDPDLIEKSDPTAGSKQVYHFGAFGSELAALDYVTAPTSSTPFEPSASVPLDATKSLGFFQRHYWTDKIEVAEKKERECASQDWRRIDHAWLGTASQLALKLDEDTNNTSLVLAIELGKPTEDGPVLLFAGDAQVGNWLSWQDVVWEDYHGRRITGPDLLRRTVVYKVGHHGSHNATLRENGLEIMDALQLALLPTNKEMAEKVGWDNFPLPALVERLAEKTGNRVVRSDDALPADHGVFEITGNELFFEVALQSVSDLNRSTS